MSETDILVEPRQCIIHAHRHASWFRVQDSVWFCGECHAKMGSRTLDPVGMPPDFGQHLSSLVELALDHVSDSFKEPFGCCPGCCARCGILAGLVIVNYLDDWARLVPSYTARGWWNRPLGQVNRVILEETWRRANDRLCHEHADW